MLHYLVKLKLLVIQKKMDLYIKGKDADTSEWDSLINQFESVRSECRDFNP